MKKVIKLKQSDIEKIVESILNEQLEKKDSEDMMGGDQDDSAVELVLGKDENGNYYVMKDEGNENMEIVAKTK